MAHIATLCHDEQVRLDSSKLQALYSQLGAAGAENVICRAMEELAVRLSDLAPLHRAGRHGELAKMSHSLVGIADQVGMATLAQVSSDVCDCASQQDPVAIAATLCRLERIGDKSLTAIWDMRDLSI
ncbi:hypothetical protein CLV78_112125 [Aliiruegeria haliotis]|uniref:Hpt domain-containing protein n=1 Tax=Aliiruegeria haliotis TaxID=1280846 RepID=A0A2T0RHZ9_9RHOB|nr:hypothetical protein [Aliiruegeria haliotis]PRY20751.1 hypothetical protein CLV78_112125 [Aliiruegeria haliotis]